ncbi:MAG: hypothetical protein EZS28_011844 [Streblomastix strix]|uniref:Uncharacterized protein n=1 Tax=Streblomastix strix TaxID=222440 RepID=A0A5J4WEA4_9EUKA|nr:MAG: hypothetical protein EZS28_011844 [Streblomastix strix]
MKKSQYGELFDAFLYISYGFNFPKEKSKSELTKPSNIKELKKTQHISVQLINTTFNDLVSAFVSTLNEIWAFIRRLLALLKPQ